jgi:molybdenum cofactor cytidylyltransferase
MSITALVLAAGASSRMGTPKALIDLEGQTFLNRIVTCARSAGASSVAVVAGPPDGDKIKARLPVGAGVTWNPDPSRGMITSVQVGIANLPPKTLCALVWPVDLPMVKVETVRRILDGTPGKIIVPRHANKTGHPVRIPRQLFGEIQSLPNDASLKTFLDGHTSNIIYVDVDDEGCVKDYDVPGDLPKATKK